MIQNNSYSVVKHDLLHSHLQLLHISFFLLVIVFLAPGCGGGGGGGGTTDNTSPSVPANVSATAASASQIDVTWTASTDDTGVTKYKVYRNAPLPVVVNEVLSGESFSDTGLSDNTQYCYNVSALDAAGNESAQSSPVACATTLEITRKLSAADALPGDQFGFSVAMSGDYAIIGALEGDTNPVDTGTAYIYRRLGPDTWGDGIEIAAADADAFDRFGTSVAISGDFAIIGAEQDDQGGNDAGAAYTFQRTGPGNTWDTGTKIMALSADANDNYGISVAISSDFAVVGATGDDDAGADSGAIYIYQKSGNTWAFHTKIPSPDSGAGDLFGVSVAISGDYIIAGATLADGNTGAAHIFHWTGSIWDPVKLIISGLDPGDFFGTAVAIDGDYAIVGARNDSDIAATAGAVYIFMRTGTNTWDTGVKITAGTGDIDSGDNFGKSVSISGDFAIIGADLDDEQAGDAGAAYIFQRSGSGNTWDSGTKISAIDFGASDLFGNAVTISNDRAIVGAFQKDEGGINAGAAYVFDIPPM